MALFLACACAALVLPSRQANAARDSIPTPPLTPNYLPNHTLPARPAGGAGDSISIVSVTPDYYSNYTDPVTFTATISYTLQSADQGVVNLGFNLNDAQSYTDTVEAATVTKGSGTCVLKATVTPVDWRANESSKGFRALASLWEYPSPDTWVALASDEYSLELRTSTDMNPDAHGTSMTDKEIRALFSKLSTIHSRNEKERETLDVETEVNADGSFVGKYHRIDKENTGPGYPNGIYYSCTFHGKFTNVRKIDDLEYYMEVMHYDYDLPTGQETDSDGMLIVAEKPSGLGGALGEFCLYMKGRSTSDLPESTREHHREFHGLATVPARLQGNLLRFVREIGLSDAPQNTNPPEFVDVPLESKRIIYDPTKKYDEGKITLYWGAALFKTPASIYNHSLALVAATLNAAGDGKGSYLPDAYAELGFEKIEYYNYPDMQVLDGSQSNEHCFSIASRKMTIDGKEQNVIAIILRGTDAGGSEPLGDLRAKADGDYDGFKVFNYFQNFSNKAYNAFDAYLTANSISYSDDIKLLIGGHSLGGAAANLLAARLTKHTSIGIDNIYTFTFGALNSIGFFENNLSEDQFNEMRFGYPNINNIINFYDSFGPEGGGADGLGVMRPAWGAYTRYAKFGNILIFQKYYAWSAFNGYAAHVMPCYLQAIKNEENVYEYTSDNKKVWISVLCPVDVDVYDPSGALVGSIKNNVMDEAATSVPMYAEGDAKFLLLPEGLDYTLKLTAFDEGEMDYYIESAEGGYDQTSYVNVALTPDKVMSSMISADSNIELFVLNDAGEAVAKIDKAGLETPLSTPAPSAAPIRTPGLSQSAPETAASKAQDDEKAGFSGIQTVIMIAIMVSAAAIILIILALIIKARIARRAKRTGEASGVGSGMARDRRTAWLISLLCFVAIFATASYCYIDLYGWDVTLLNDLFGFNA